MDMKGNQTTALTNNGKQFL